MLKLWDVLSQKQLKHLSEHKYSSTGCTLLDPIMQPFWNWLTQKFPLWLAPNAMTVIGLILNIITSLILVFYSPDCVQEAPRWSFVLCALGLFIYQTLDACDGKQARRTNSCSPIGELFDHGCDALSTTLVAITVCIAIELGRCPMWMFVQCFLALTLFYCAHWQTYVAGTLEFGKFDVTEVQFSLIFIYTVSAIFGSSVWSLRIPYIRLELRLLPVITEILTGSIILLRNITVIFISGRGKNDPSVKGVDAIKPIVPLALVVLSAFAISQKSHSLYVNNPCLYIAAFGLVSAKVTIRLVVAHMTQSEINYFDSVFIGPGLLILNQYFNDFVSNYIILWLCLVYALLDFLFYSVALCSQICSYLQIPLFTIKPASLPDDSTESSTDPSVTTPLLQSIANDEPSKLSVAEEGEEEA